MNAGNGSERISYGICILTMIRWITWNTFMNRTQYLIQESDRFENDLKGTMPKLAYMLVAMDYEYEDGELSYQPDILIWSDKQVDAWKNEYLIPILLGLSSVMAGVNKMLYDEYKVYGNVSGAETGVMAVVGNMLQSGSYLDSVSELSGVKSEIKRFLVTAMSSGYTKKQLSDGIKEILSEGGVLDRYFKTYLYDVISQYDRMVARAMADKLELKHFLYSGNIIKDTRDFCIERSGKVFSVKEAKKWNDLHWRGKIEGVDVMVALGGYNCRHWVSYISEELFNKRMAEGNKGSEDYE